jgi:ATP-dependent RNA helicase DDX24/MAK5
LRDAGGLKALVFDEADRMVAQGHFKEINSIIEHIQRVTHCLDPTADPDAPDEKMSESGYILAEPEVSVLRTTGPRPRPYQTFLFSATLPSEALSSMQATEGTREANTDPVMEKLLRVAMGKSPFVCDLTSSRVMVPTLTEAMVETTEDDKDFYLYYLLVKNPGRAIVFVNAITCLRRVLGILKALRLPAVGLHSEMQQKARLKAVESLKVNSHAVLVCTDLAARGLDIANVDYVVHYQFPRDSETYVHRCGRTARAGRDGNTLLLVQPSERKRYAAMCEALEKEGGVPLFHVDLNFFQGLRERVKIARKIDIASNHESRNDANKAWYTLILICLAWFVIIWLEHFSYPDD